MSDNTNSRRFQSLELEKYFINKIAGWKELNVLNKDYSNLDDYDVTKADTCVKKELDRD